MVVTRATPRRPARRAASLALVGLALAACAALLAGCGGSASGGEARRRRGTSKTVANAAEGDRNPGQEPGTRRSQARRGVPGRNEGPAGSPRRNEEQEAAEAAAHKKHAHKSPDPRRPQEGRPEDEAPQDDRQGRRRAPPGSPAMEPARKRLEAEESAENRRHEQAGGGGGNAPVTEKASRHQPAGVWRLVRGGGGGGRGGGGGGGGGGRGGGRCAGRDDPSHRSGGLDPRPRLRPRPQPREHDRPGSCSSVVISERRAGAGDPVSSVITSDLIRRLAWKATPVRSLEKSGASTDRPAQPDPLLDHGRVAHEVLVPHEQPPLARLARNTNTASRFVSHRYAFVVSVDFEYWATSLRLKEATTLRAVPREVHQIEVYAGQRLQLAGAQRIVRGLDDVGGRRVLRDRPVEALRYPPVGLAKASAGAPTCSRAASTASARSPARPRARRARARDVLLHARPEALALVTVELRLSRPGEPRVQLAGVEHPLAVPERDTEDRAPAAPAPIT